MSKVPSGGIGAALALMRIAMDMLAELHGQCECLGCGEVLDMDKKDEHRKTCTKVRCIGCDELLSVDELKTHLVACEKHPTFLAVQEERKRCAALANRWCEGACSSDVNGLEEAITNGVGLAGDNRLP
jgi:hypothetical protein